MNFPKHACGLYLAHNQHKGYYQTAAEYVADYGDDLVFRDQEAQQRAIDTNEIWTLQWYPDTPIGSYAVAAPTFEELLELANSYSVTAEE